VKMLAKSEHLLTSCKEIIRAKRCKLNLKIVIRTRTEINAEEFNSLSLNKNEKRETIFFYVFSALPTWPAKRERYKHYEYARL